MDCLSRPLLIELSINIFFLFNLIRMYKGIISLNFANLSPFRHYHVYALYNTFVSLIKLAALTVHIRIILNAFFKSFLLKSIVYLTDILINTCLTKDFNFQVKFLVLKITDYVLNVNIQKYMYMIVYYKLYLFKFRLKIINNRTTSLI